MTHKIHVAERGCRICLIASCPGGTASNVVTFLANADVALSVMMTTVSTFAAVVMTPLLTKTLVGAMVPVDSKALFVSTLQVNTFRAVPPTWRFRLASVVVTPPLAVRAIPVIDVLLAFPLQKQAPKSNFDAC